MNRKQLIQEVISGGFEQYDEAGLVDRQSLNRWIRLELTRFGSNIMLGNEKTIQVSNGKAKLPESFWKLDLALKVDVSSIEGRGEKKDYLQSSLFYKERREVDVKWDNASDSYQFENFKCISEDIYMPTYSLKIKYENPVFLNLTKSFNKEKLTSKYHELSKRFTNSSQHEINIVGDYINTNFSEGWIYIQYSGLELDEEGELIIPACNHSRISEYLITYCRWRILEDVIVGGDDPNKINLLSYYKQKKEEDFTLALRDAEWFGAQGWRQAMKKAKFNQMNVYERMLPNK